MAILVFAVLLAMILGFAAHRASICTVRTHCRNHERTHRLYAGQRRKVGALGMGGDDPDLLAHAGAGDGCQGMVANWLRHARWPPVRPGPHREPEQLSSTMAKDEKRKQALECQSWDQAKIDRRNGVGMIAQKCPPCLGWRAEAPGHVLGDRRL